MRKFIILFFLLIILIPVILFVIKTNDLKKNQEASNKTVNSTPSAVNTIPNGFINANNLDFPSGFSFTKAMNAKEDMGKFALYYNYDPVSVDGTEWVATKEVNTPEEYNATLNEFKNFYISKILKNGWVNEQQVEGYSLQPLSADGPMGSIYGLAKYDKGNVQVILFYDNRGGITYPLNAQFRLFISNVYILKEIVK